MLTCTFMQASRLYALIDACHSGSMLELSFESAVHCGRWTDWKTCGLQTVRSPPPSEPSLLALDKLNIMPLQRTASPTAAPSLCLLQSGLGGLAIQFGAAKRDQTAKEHAGDRRV